MEKDETNIDVLIIGAGLTGLTLGYLLSSIDVSYKIIEARDRIGGRIHTIGYEQGQPTEMGATWLGSQHTNLAKLLSDLDIPVREQYLGNTAIYEPNTDERPRMIKMPPVQDPSLRIDGGSKTVISKLASLCKSQTIKLGEKVETISFTDVERVEVETTSATYNSKIVISTLPPNLLRASICMTPSLPEDTIELMTTTHTWMGESIKVGLSYESAFWLSRSTSCTIFSNKGPITEMYDHTSSNGKYFALKGFVAESYATMDPEERKEAIVNQLVSFYGEQAKSFLSYHEAIWSNESFTHADYRDFLVPHQNNGHQLYRLCYQTNRLVIAGTETASKHPGYMEGAVVSAMECQQIILRTLKQLS